MDKVMTPGMGVQARRQAMCAVCALMFALPTSALDADAEAARRLLPREPIVEIVEGQERSVCKAYEGFINYARGPDGLSGSDYDAIPREPGFGDFAVPEWGGMLQAKFPEMVDWDSANGLINEYFWAHDVNLVGFFPFDENEEYVWKPTQRNIATARERYWNERSNPYVLVDIKRAAVDINNDGVEDYLWRSDYMWSRAGSLVATNERGDAIDSKLTALLRQHRGRDEMGLGYFVEVAPEDLHQFAHDKQVQKTGVIRGGDAFSAAHYHVFSFGQQTYFSLQWALRVWAKVVAGEQLGKATVFKATGDHVDTECVMKFLR